MRASRRAVVKGALSSTLAAPFVLRPHRARAAEVTLRVMHFLPPQAPAQTKLIEPWLQSLAEASDGRIGGQVFPAMQLGGKPPQLVDQVRDGIVDVVWTLPSYTPGRYPKMSVFELPFMAASAPATSQAMQSFYEAHAKEEFQGIHPLLFHGHAPGVVHTKGKGVEKAADFQGLKLRAPGRSVGDALAKFGATPIFMPVPQVPEAISKGVIEGAVVPWEVTQSLRLYELTDHHTEIKGERGLYTAVFMLAMNQGVYEGMADDLRKIVDDHSGMAIAKAIGEAWSEAEAAPRAKAVARGNTIIEMDPSEVQKLKDLSVEVQKAWIDEQEDGQALFDAANGLIDQYAA